tara:strand:- start:275 stop:1027 length:753 start_codon:yes stop_codon:yes gene_type:complete
MSKYFTVEVRPTIPNVAAGQHATFGTNDLVFDWYAFDIPKGTSRLVGATIEVRPKGDAGATMNKIDLDLLFAKTVNGNAPTSLGTVNSALTANVNSSNEIIAFLDGGSWSAHEAHLDSTAFATMKQTTLGWPCFTGEPDSGTNVGYDRFYMAGIAAGAFDFVSSTLINNGDLNGPVMTVNGTSPLLFMAVGDTVNVTTTADTSVSKSMGVIKSMTSTSITLEEAFTTGDVVHEDIVYNTAPIRLQLHFEK